MSAWDRDWDLDAVADSAAYRVDVERWERERALSQGWPATCADGSHLWLPVVRGGLVCSGCGETVDREEL